jgi:cell division inhibitor SulA/protein ImuA
LGTLIELLLPVHGLGELRLLMPALRRQLTPSPGEAPRWLVWISPPHEPYPPALAQSGLDPARMLRIDAPQPADRLWAIEQVLHSGSAAVVLCWLDAVDDRWLRRLKLAVEGQSVLLIALRPITRRHTHSPASLRMELVPTPQGLDLMILKERGRAPTRVAHVFGA